MKISLEEIEKRSEPYQAFLDSIKSPDTLRRYKNNIHGFLQVILDEVYQKELGKIPADGEKPTLANIFVELARKNQEMVKSIIVAYIKKKRELVEKGIISSQTLPNYTKPIKALLDANGIAIHWKSINKLLPRRESSSNDRAYTKQELQKMILACHDITDKLIIQLFSSAGFRLQAWDDFTWKDYTPFKNGDGTYKGGALLVYRGDPEAYWTFITPEACKTLEIYREQWKSEVGAYPRPDEPLIKTVRFPTVHRLNYKGVRKRVEIIVKRIGLRPPLPPGKRRHEVQLDHGFRKYFNTMMRRAKVNYLDKEDMMGHKVGLEKHYERYQEEDFERFPEYQKAIPFLTISDEEKLRYENLQKAKELEQLKNDSQYQKLEKRVDSLENGPKARRAHFLEAKSQNKDDKVTEMWLVIIQWWFEIRATEEEKRKIWKKIQEAKRTGEKTNWLETSVPNFSWNNLPSLDSYK